MQNLMSFEVLTSFERFLADGTHEILYIQVTFRYMSIVFVSFFERLLTILTNKGLWL